MIALGKKTNIFYLKKREDGVEGCWIGEVKILVKKYRWDIEFGWGDFSKINIRNKKSQNIMTNALEEYNFGFNFYYIDIHYLPR